jgi:hypothetical protein
MQAHSCRFIIEAGCWTNEEDRRILEDPDFPARHAVGLLEAYAALASRALGWTGPHLIGRGGG